MESAIEIGGFFELELNKGKPHHSGLIALNTGRNAFQFVLECRHYNKIYIPFYTCDALLEPINKLGVEYEYYRIDESFQPVIESKIDDNSALVVIDYFGLNCLNIHSLFKVSSNIIVDNSQAFYSLPHPLADTFYSCRKFFGVPDGAYLSFNGKIDREIKTDFSTRRISHLINRIEAGAQSAYADFKNNEALLSGLPILQMSNLTKALLANINYEVSAFRRLQNFKTLHSHLNSINELKWIAEPNGNIPMIYPLLVKSASLRDWLIKNNVYVAKYWPNVQDWCSQESWEFYLAKYLLPLPIDQRYGLSEMMRIITLIK